MEGRGATATYLWETGWVPFTCSGTRPVSLRPRCPPASRADGLPLAVQLVGRPNDEATLLSLAAQLERARPWADRRPPVS